MPALNTKGYSSAYPAAFLGTRPNISESHSEISTRVPFCIAPQAERDAEVASITLRSSHVALFVVLTTTAQGRFSDNAFTLLPSDGGTLAAKADHNTMIIMTLYSMTAACRLRTFVLEASSAKTSECKNNIT